MVLGGRRHFRELRTRSEEGISSNIVAQFMTEPREAHLGVPTKRKGPSAAERLRAAYEMVVGKREVEHDGANDGVDEGIPGAFIGKCAECINS